MPHDFKHGKDPIDPKNPDPKDDKWLSGQDKGGAHGNTPNTDGKK